MSSGQTGSGTAAQRTADKPTLAGTRNRQRKRNQVVPHEPKKFVQQLLPCIDPEALDDFARRLDEAESAELLDLKRYGDIFWDVLIAGGPVSSGGEIGDGENALNAASAFGAPDDAAFDAVCDLVTGVMQRRPFLRPVLESTFARLALFVTSFSEAQVGRLAEVMGRFYAANAVPAQFLVALKQNDRLVERGHAIAFAAQVMRVVAGRASVDKLLASLKLAKMEHAIADLFPTRDRDPAAVQKYFSDNGLPAITKYLQDSKVQETLAAVQGAVAAGEEPEAVAENFAAEVAAHGLNPATSVSILFRAITAAVPYTKRTGQHGQQFLEHLSRYGAVLEPYASQSLRVQVDLLNKVQLECAERQGLNKSFGPAVRSLYESDAVSEDAILVWHQGGPKVGVVAKGREEAVAQTDKFVEWLQDAEEESDDDDESGEEESDEEE